MEKVSITREMDARRGRYVARIEGSSAEAELTFIRAEPGILVADHTLTPVPLRGRGIATQLVERLVSDARREGFRIRPTCPFVAGLFDQHSDWADLRVL
jgi:predicted GNAT family acetyltransferase